MRLFGSRARGDASPDSDVDVAVVVRDLTDDERAVAIDLAMGAWRESGRLGPLLSPLVWDDDERRKSHIIRRYPHVRDGRHPNVTKLEGEDARRWRLFWRLHDLDELYARLDDVLVWREVDRVLSREDSLKVSMIVTLTLAESGVDD